MASYGNGSNCSAEERESAEQLARRRGRPAEDRFLRRSEIYMAVLPLLRDKGWRSVSMTEAAAAADMSLGGLRHYFPTRDDLVFFPLMRESCDEGFRRFFDDPAVAGLSPDQFVESFLATFATTAPIARSALDSAVDLGSGFFRRLADTHGEADLGELHTALRLLGARPEAQSGPWLHRFLRRQFIAIAMGHTTTDDEILSDLRYALGIRQPVVPPVAPVIPGLASPLPALATVASGAGAG